MERDRKNREPSRRDRRTNTGEREKEAEERAAPRLVLHLLA